MRRNRRINRPAPDSARGASKAAHAELIYGFHPVLAALRNPARRKRRLLLTKEAKKSLANEVPAIENAVAECRTVARAEIASTLPPGAVHQGFLLECQPLAALTLEDCCTPRDDNSPLLVLDQVSDPHNVGAILRSAAAFGACAVVLQERHSPSATGVLAKAASGALESVPLVRVTNLARAMRQLKDMGYWLIGLDANAETPLGAAPLNHPVALVVGAEGSGLRRLTRENCDALAAIKLADAMHSLNVSNAAAVALYQLTLEL